MIERFRAMHDFPSCDITAEVRKTPNKRIVLGLTAYYSGPGGDPARQMTICPVSGFPESWKSR